MTCKFLIRAGFAGIVIAAALARTADGAEIVRDKFGVPHIYGASVADAFFGYGYAVAEDRLFQLEMRRRQATGQLAAVLGKEVKNGTTGAPVNILNLDMQMRRDHDRDSLMKQFASLRPEEQALINGYLAGVNKRIAEVKADNGKLLPQQFRDVWGGELASKALNPWSLDDLLAATTNALSSYVSHTTMEENAVLHAALHKKYGADAQNIFDTLLWVNDLYAPTTMGNNPGVKHAGTVPKLKLAESSPPAQLTVIEANAGNVESAEAAETTPDTDAATTSMAILVGGSKTGGASIQLNGPQPGWFLPSYFYSVGLHAPGYDVVGHAPGGLLAITTGDNGTIAWGSTSAGGDHTTVFEERLSQDRRHYEFQGKQREVLAATSTIDVKGQKPVVLQIYRTHRGPFITRLDAPVVYSKQVLWKGHELSSVMAWQRATQAKDWKAFHAEGLDMAMGYNWYYSDKDGNIGWLFGGFFPDQTPGEKKARDPRLPAIGAEGDMKGRSFADELYLVNPESGYIVNWNNKPSVGYDNRDLHIPRWSQGDRANILADLMKRRAQQSKPITAQDVQEIYHSASTQDVNFYHFGPLFKTLNAASADHDTQHALKLLQDWNGERLPDPANPKAYGGAAVPIFQEWLNQFVKRTVGAVLAGDEFQRFAGPYAGTLQLPYMKNSVNLSMGTKIALRGLQARFDLRPEDKPAYDVLHRQDPQQLMLVSLQAAVAALKTKNPSKPIDTWRQAMVPQNFFPENYESVPTASAAEKPTLPSSANRGAMQRLAVGGGGRMESVDANPPGTSSDPKSAHYKDQLSIYGDWGFKPLPLNPKKTGTGKVIHMQRAKL